MPQAAPWRRGAPLTAAALPPSMGPLLALALTLALALALPGPASAQRRPGGPLDASPAGGRDPRLLGSVAGDAAAIRADTALLRANASAEASAAAAKAPDQAWADFKARWGRSYGAEEEGAHSAAFARALAFTAAYNANASASAFMRLGPLSDATPDEFRRLHGIDPSAGNATAARALLTTAPAAELGAGGGSGSGSSALPPGPPSPSAVNWVARGRVAPIANQGQCGDCWAFAATAVVESMQAIAAATNATSLSPQQVLDCTPPRFKGNGTSSADGCGGASELWAGLVFPYARLGLATAQQQPYGGAQGACSDGVGLAVNLTGVGAVAGGSEAALMAALNAGPIVVSVAASSAAFQYYGGGVFDDFAACAACRDPSGAPTTCVVDHAVALVGYDSAEGYWILRNSWGPDWGIGGYMLLAMGTRIGHSTGMCRILEYGAASASVGGGGPVPSYWEASLPSRAVVNQVFYGGQPLAFDLMPPSPPPAPPRPPGSAPPPPSPPGGAAGAPRPRPWASGAVAALLGLALALAAGGARG
ncbi:hypothetical protein HYH03_015343 [Edaphochlamys debaryana]|uniref:Peptidase C1A papain C-terminal domain-containing protein n=1 Tax=Edaphochlamys debaryana TaxID=47281 RepID=A0A835XKR7_9CHLO|nr:hypothetical protein HYH03_015343 [Edaphochlamys debaryana]|eukprot:KAG2485898.1 hypothetical protein HYH03_015343 [Edaphochlamys debaryana]